MPEEIQAIAPAADVIGSLLATLAPPAETFEIHVGRAVFEFRYFADGDEYRRLRNQAAEWARLVSGKLCPAEIREYRVKDTEVLVYCFLLGKQSRGARMGEVAEGPVGEVRWLAFAKAHGLAFDTVCMQFDAETTGNARLREARAIEEGKDDSPPTRSAS